MKVQDKNTEGLYEIMIIGDMVFVDTSISILEAKNKLILAYKELEKNDKSSNLRKVQFRQST